MSLTTCTRHPDEPAKALCGRCGDFLCAKCKAESPAGLCPACGQRAAPAPGAASGATLALVAATLCALLAGGFLLATSGLYLYVAKTGVNPIGVWNGAMGLIYFVIAYGLVVRAPWGYSWSLGTQRLNAFIGGYYMAQHLSRPTPTVIIVLSGISLGFHLAGWLATWLARPAFQRSRGLSSPEH